MIQRALLYGVAIGVAVAALIASFESYRLWRLNPGGIFHSATGTDLRAVWETWISWFVPVFAVVAVLSVAVFGWRASRRAKQADSK